MTHALVGTGDKAPISPARKPVANGVAVPLDHPQWLRELWHYDPDYAYDLARYEYGASFTTDPHYIEEDVRLAVNEGHFAWVLQAVVNLNRFFYVVYGWTKPPVTCEVRIQHLPTHFRSPLLQRTRYYVDPDWVLWPPGTRVTRRSSMNYGYDEDGDGIPLMILECLSPATEDMDWNDKRDLYREMGVQEYWLCDYRVPGTLSGYQGHEGQWDHVQVQDGNPLFSHVLQTYIRHDAELGLQAQDPATGAWLHASVRDRDEGRAEGQAEDRRKSLLAVASLYLDTDTLAACQDSLRNFTVDAMPSVDYVLHVGQTADSPAKAVAALLLNPWQADTSA